jgi:hypothetical protein
LLRHIRPHVSLSPLITRYLDRMTSRDSYRKSVVVEAV